MEISENKTKLNPGDIVIDIFEGRKWIVAEQDKKESTMMAVKTIIGSDLKVLSVNRETHLFKKIFDNVEQSDNESSLLENINDTVKKISEYLENCSCEKCNKTRKDSFRNFTVPKQNEKRKKKKP